jgi:hypothetical protein
MVDILFNQLGAVLVAAQLQAGLQKFLAGAYYQQHLTGTLEPSQALAGLAPRQMPVTGWLLFQRHNHPIESERSPKL